MHRFLMTFTLGLFAFSTAALAGDECRQNPCIATFSTPAPPVAPVDDMVCVNFTQRRAGDVMIVLYANPPRGEEHEGSGILFKKNRWQSRQGKYCFGRWRLNGVAWLLVCNDAEHATRGVLSLTRLREEGAIELCSLSHGCS